MARNAIYKYRIRMARNRLESEPVPVNTFDDRQMFIDGSLNSGFVCLCDPGGANAPKVMSFKKLKEALLKTDRNGIEDIVLDFADGLLIKHVLEWLINQGFKASEQLIIRYKDNDKCSARLLEITNMVTRLAASKDVEIIVENGDALQTRMAKRHIIRCGYLASTGHYKDFEDENPIVRELSLKNYENVNRYDCGVPESCSRTEGMGEPLDQGNFGACAAFAASAILKYHGLDVNPFLLYGPERHGMSTGELINSLGTKNPLRIWLETKRDKNDKMGAMMLKSLEGIGSLDVKAIGNLVEAKHAIFKHGPLYLVLPALKGCEIHEFWKSRLDNTSDPVMDSHAVVITSYDDKKRCFVILNSWGDKWGTNGTAELSYEDFMIYALECYVFIPKTGPVLTPRSKAGTLPIPRARHTAVSSR